MSSESYIIAFETLLAIAGCMSVAYMLFVRKKRELILHKYKPGTSGYSLYQKLFRPSSLIISIVLALLFLSSLVATLISQVSKHATIDLLLIPGLCVVIFLVIFFAMFNSFNKK